MASRAVPASARHLRLVHPGQRAASKTQTDVATRRTLVMLLGATAFLVSGGLIMVLSASSITAYAQFGDSFLFFQRQAGYAVAGTLALWLTSRMRYQAWQRLAVPMLGVTVALLLLVLHPAAGVEAYELFDRIRKIGGVIPALSTAWLAR